MVLALLIKRQRVPCGQVFDAKPIKNGLHVFFVLRGCIWPCGHVSVNRQEEVGSFVQEGGHIRLLVEYCGQSFRIEPTAFWLTEYLSLRRWWEKLGYSFSIGVVKGQRARAQVSGWCRRLDLSLLGLEFTDLRGKHRVLAFGACRRRIRAL